MALNKAQNVFVDEMIKHGDEDLAVVIAYPHLKGDNKQIRTYCGRLMKNVEISSVIQQRASEIRQLATSEAVELLKNEIVANTLTAIEKRNLLATIARGEARIQESYFDKESGEMESYLREPSAFEKIKAIEVDNKMAGDNAATKQDIKVDGITAAINEDKFKQLLEAAREGIKTDSSK